MIHDQKYLISGMSCAACSARIDKAIRNLKGVKEVNVNLLTNSMVVTYNEKHLNSEKIIKEVTKAGYGASLVDTSNSTTAISKEELEDHETPKLIKRLIASLILLVPLFYLSMGYMLSWPIGLLKSHLYALAIIEFVLSITIMVINNKFFVNGFKAVIHKSLNMDTLVALGSGVAFIYSTIMMIILFVNTANQVNEAHLNMIMMNISFETAGMVPTLITIGKTLESYSKGKTTNAIKALMDLSPKTALILKDNKEMGVKVEEVKIGDTFVVKPGMSIPVDGEVIKGESSVNESMLTGEALPIDKVIGSLVKSGTINENGVLICSATRVGKDTTINQIISSVEKAANSKARISKLADKVSGIFVPIVIAISLIVFISWMIFGKAFLLTHQDIMSSQLSYSIERAISVLVISCPCALGLATPVAIMVGSGKGAKNGVLFKNAEAIEESGKIDYLVLDKTGTITEGKPSVNGVKLIGEKKEIYEVSYALESNSDHPLAKAIYEYLKDKNVNKIEVTNFINVSGKGISGEINGHRYYIGNKKFMDENKVNIKNIIDDFDKYSSQGKTVILLAKEKEIIALYAISDKIKKDSKEAIDKIKKLGIVPIMLTGDNELSARYIASLVDIDYVISDVLPEGKLEVIELLKSKGRVMMVGDGINDAIALTSANVGVAIGKGSDVAIDSGSIVLMKDSLLDVYAAIRLSQYVYLNIKENLFWAFIYNLIMIPIASGVLSTLGVYKLLPWMGSAAMAVSSIFVVLNALRINLFNPYKESRKNKKVALPTNLLTYNSCEIKETSKMEKVIKVEGMMCMHCVAHVKEALESLRGVESVEVSLERNEAKITSKKEIKDKDIEKVISKAGYKVVK